MEAYIVVTSVNELANIKAFKPLLQTYNCKLIIIDEGDEKIRKINEELISEISHIYYGPQEREEWFKQRFGFSYKKYLAVIPKKCHAETSFGFLVAYEEKPKLVIELDDDVFPVQTQNLVNGHFSNLFNESGVTVYSKSRWYNVMENMELNIRTLIFPRGHPYAQEARTQDYAWDDASGRCILNIGLWTGYPDLDALTILYYGGLDGRCNIKGKNSKRDKIIVGKGTYFAVCSMNAAFSPEIIPAFYQLYMNFMGVDRFDDIWSGIFLKKIADHVSDKVCVGEPLVYHDKRLRSVFKDLRAELEGIIINEHLWRIVDGIELKGKDYFECYRELADGIERRSNVFFEKLYSDFLKFQVKKMNLWLEIINKLE